MTEEEAVFQRGFKRLQEMPADLSLRLYFADFLERRGDARGELLRLTHTLTQSVSIENRRELETRLRTLVEEGVQPIGPFWTNSLGMTFAWIPPGIFMMGSPKEEIGHQCPNSPYCETQHQVTLSKGFYMAIHPITVQEWHTAMGTTYPRYDRGYELPVEISWEACQAFITKMRDQDKKAYRLPTEAEWEYACRAGTTTPFHFGETISTEQANYNGQIYGDGKQGECRHMSTLVGSFGANAWGLHDMHGNIQEWCQDWYGEYPQNHVVDPQGPKSGEYRVVRGGSWIMHPICCRSAGRSWHKPNDGCGALGLRLCFSLDSEPGTELPNEDPPPKESRTADRWPYENWTVGDILAREG